MNAQVVVVGFGGLLTLIGLVGGGFSFKDLAVPKIHMGARIASVVIGLALVVFGVVGFEEDPDAATDAKEAPQVQK